MTDWNIELEPYVRHLRQLPFVREAEIREVQPDTAPHRADAVLRLKTAQGRFEFLVELKRTNLTYAIAEGPAARGRKELKRPWILFAPYVTREMGRHLAQHGLNYIDEPGNCRLQVGEDHIAVIEGLRPARAHGRGRGVGAAGYQVLFAILAKPDLLNAPVRTLADEAGV